jgi:hypothetical protein
MQLELPSSSEELTAAIRASLDLIKLGPPRVTIPLVAGVYAPLIDYCDFSIHVFGRTGVHKSELAARIQQHFGRAHDRLHLPGHWGSTPNAIESMCFTAKDAVVVIDEYVTNGLSKSKREELEAKAARLFRAQGNQSGRGRLNAKLEQRPDKPPRGLIISTGEDVLGTQSLAGRLLQLEIKIGDIDRAPLTKAQEAGARGEYARASGGFVQWLAAGRLDEWREFKQSTVSDVHDLVYYEGAHPRMAQIIGALLFSWLLFL